MAIDGSSQADGCGVVNSGMTTAHWIFLGLTVTLSASLVFCVVRREGKGNRSLLLAAVVCAFLSDADRFDLFQFSFQGGLVAKMRAVVADAEGATKCLRDVAVAASAAIIELNGVVSNGGLAMLPKAAIRDENKRNLIGLLQEMKVSDLQLKKVKDADRDSVIGQYAFSITAKIGSFVNRYGSQTDKDELRIFDPYIRTCTPEEFRRIVAEAHVTDEKTLSLIDDYAFYVLNREQRRPEVWAERDNW